MGQIRRDLCRLFVMCLIVAGCGRQASPRPTAKSPTVASLVPTATDIIIAMQAGDHLVGVSNYDSSNPTVPNLPRVGDYQNTDWEKLADIRPQVMIIQMTEAAVPPGLRSRAADLKIRLVNIQNNSLDDLKRTIAQIAEAIDERAKGQAAVDAFEQRLHAVADSVKGRPPVRTLIVLDDEGNSVVGPGGFLDTILHIAGGTNAAESLNVQYGSIDRERLIQMNPQAIIQLLPNASVEQVASAHRAFADLTQVDAVKNNRIYTLTEWYLLLGSTHLADVAEKFAAVLNQRKETQMNADERR
jgi:iron complex transport system substrate-binding protein